MIRDLKQAKWDAFSERMRRNAATAAARARHGFGGGAEEVPCEYCYQAKASHDPVLGWVCVKCEREITEGRDDDA